MMSGSDGVTVTVRWTAGKATQSAALLQFDTPAVAPVHFEAVEADGTTPRNVGTSSNGWLRTYEFATTSDRIAKIRASYLPHVARVIIDLPDIPGLPEVNRGVDDLMEMRVPYTSIAADYNYRNLLCAVLQLNLSAYAGDRPTNQPTPLTTLHYPLEFRDTTVREILARYESTLPSHKLKVDMAKDELCVVYPDPTPWGIRLLRILGLYR